LSSQNIWQFFSKERKIIGSSKKNTLKKLREDIKKASQEAQKVWDANKNDRNPLTGQLSANAKVLIGKAEQKIRSARISSGGGVVEMIDDDEYNKIRNKY
jgi:ketol-acid reductoisomerase